MRTVLLLILAVFCGAGLVHEAQEAASTRYRTDAEIEEAAFQCRNEIRPRIRGALEFAEPAITKEHPGYVLVLTVYHDVVGDTTPEHSFVCRVAATNGHVKVLSLGQRK